MRGGNKRAKLRGCENKKNKSDEKIVFFNQMTDRLLDGVYKVDHNDIGVSTNSSVFYYVYINCGKVYKVENNEHHVMRNHNYHRKTNKYAVFYFYRKCYPEKDI